jgi:hypothetical protein
LTALPNTTIQAASCAVRCRRLIRLAAKAAPDKNAADTIATPYAITVSMIVDRLDDKQSYAPPSGTTGCFAKDILIDMYNTEHEVRIRIDLLGQPGLGERLDSVMGAIAALVEAEVSRFPDNIGHVLGSRSLRSHQSPAGPLAYLASKGRDAMSSGAVFCRKLIRSA